MCTLQDGDVVVLGSDGLFDNVWEDDLLALVQARLEVSHCLAMCSFCFLLFLGLKINRSHQVTSQAEQLLPSSCALV